MADATPIEVSPDDVEWTAIRAQGAGGQNVNKVSSAVQLRFDVRGSSLPDEIKARLLALPDQRITREGEVVIKAQRYRSQDRNRVDALERLNALVQKAALVLPPRRATRPTVTARRKRVDAKTRRGEVKATRRRVTDE
ncbi:MAG: alternative ribosome rescue aminoacyl-tRNA hydrolase ArfB [Casimicrobiaceae bacterium]